MDNDPDYTFRPAVDHPVIEGVWHLATGPGEDRIAPDARCEIIFHLAEPPLERSGSDWQRQPRQMIYGPLTRVLDLRRTSPMDLMAIRLRPEGVGTLVDDPARLRNRSCGLKEVLPETLVNALASAARTGFDAFEAEAVNALAVTPQRSASAIRVTRAIQHFASHPALRPSGLAKAAGVTHRTLDRDFMRQTGLTPGEFLQITRYHLARQAIRTGTGSLSDIAMETGYADQAHMTRDFRRFAGKTPRLKRGGDASDIFYSAG